MYFNNCFIYKIINTINNKIYIGQTWRSIYKRFNEHCNINNKKKSAYLLNAIQKYGKENFKIELIMICHTQEIADYWEQYFIEYYNSNNRKTGYNIRDGGSKGKLPQKTRRKMSIAKIGVAPTEQAMVAAHLANTGRIHSEKEINKRAESHRGMKRSESTKKNISDSKIGKPSHRLGIKLSEETINKMSAASIANNSGYNFLDKNHSEESKNKISKANTGRYKNKSWCIIDGKRVWSDK